LALNVAVTLAMQAEGPAPRITTLRLTRFMVLWVFTPLAALVVITGLWMTEEYFDAGDLWISLGMAGWLIAVAVMLAVIWPRAGRVLQALEAGETPVPSPSPAIYAARFNLVLLSAVLVIMVIRPG